ncbi:MAG: hypothetical protein Q9227_000922 [Pyrenula ochraceoflavens]
MAAELKRKGSTTVVLAMHPGEVATEMANISVDWDIEGILTPEESVTAMLKVIPDKTLKDSGTFWTWEGKVGAIHEPPRCESGRMCMLIRRNRSIRGD